MKRFIKELRQATKLTQKAFAERYNIPLSTLRKWEQGESFPADYVIALIEATIPEFMEGLEKIYGDEGEIYYLDRTSKRVSDSLGNWISFSESIDGIIERNLPVYLKDLFSDFYRAQKHFNDDLMYDKKEKIEWR